jgi:diguanylate cyclase (GGDEF)-like protein/PAS domain S-box-containing protein
MPRDRLLRPGVVTSLVVLAMTGLFALDAALPAVILFPYYFVLVVAASLVVSPRRVAALAAWALILTWSAGPLTLDEDDGAEFWSWLVAMVIFVVLALVIARVGRTRERAAIAANRLLAEVVNATDSPIFAKDYSAGGSERGRYVFGNQAWAETALIESGDASDVRDGDIYPGAVAETLLAADEAVVLANEPRVFEERVGTDLSVLREFMTTKFPLRRDDGSVWGVGGIAVDVTELNRERRRLDAVFSQSPVPTVRLLLGPHATSAVLDANDAATDLLGINLTDAPTEVLRSRVHADDRAVARDVLRDRRDEVPLATARSREVRLVGAGGATIWVSLSASPVGDAEPDGSREYVVQFEDITVRKELESELTERALTDSVTGLPNRVALADRLATALSRLTRRPGLVAVLFCDLDHFKQINDVFGHGVGDDLLVEVAHRLSLAVRPEDSLVRHGGDEFVVVCEGLTDPAEAVLLALRLQDRLRDPWVHEGHQFRPTASIGVAVTGDPYADPADLLRQADLAMYQAKDKGRDGVEPYDESLDLELAHAVAMQQRLRESLVDDGLVLHYQPIVRLRDGAVQGAEALVRMRDRDGRLIGPDQFLPHAEASGLMTQLGAWVLDQAVADLVHMREAGRDLTMAINLSPTQLRRDGLAAQVLEAVARAGGRPEWFVVEVTESVLIQDNDVVTGALDALHTAGIRIALDDFGTGYSSLSWLHQFPVDIVKIDKSFVQKIGVDSRRAAIIRALLDVAASSGLEVVAEGVETEQQRDLLIAMGCTVAQGYLFGRPVPIEDAMWTTAIPVSRPTA